MSDDDIRRALDDLIGQPPITLGRRGAVMRRIERVHARRRVAVQATLSAFLVASAAFGATRVVSTTPAGNDSLVQQEQREDTDDKHVPVESPKPDQPADKAKPRAKQKAGPKPTAAPDQPDQPEETVAPDDPKPTYDAPDKPEPTYTTEPDKPEPTSTKPPVANGLSVEFWPYTDAVAGAPMDWKVKAYDTAGRLLRIEVRFGDGQSKVYEPSDACAADVNVKKFFTHTYAKAGTYTGTAIVTTGECGAPTESKTVTQSVKVVAEGAGNGPAVPTVSAGQVDGQEKVTLHGADSDGFVKKFWVDWGDGSPETYVGPRSLDLCEPGKGSTWDTTATHDYSEPGTYTVTVTVMSTNCDGGQGQTKSVTTTVTV